MSEDIFARQEQEFLWFPVTSEDMTVRNAQDYEHRYQLELFQKEKAKTRLNY